VSSGARCGFAAATSRRPAAYVGGSTYAYTYNARKRLVLVKKDAADAGE
jgi:hypothetical protein